MAREVLLSANDTHAGPIRSYSEVVEIMRQRGDKTITKNQIYWYERSAFRKLRPLLEGWSDYFT